MSTEMIPRDQSLSFYAADLEAICTQIDACDGEIPKDLMAKFNFAELALKDKCERWIWYRDVLDGMILALDKRAKRAQAALKGAKSLQAYLDDGMKFVIEQNPNLTFKGESGTLYLHGHRETIAYALKFSEKKIEKIVDETTLKLEPSIGPYLKDVTYQVIDTDKLKSALQAGTKLNWASLFKGSDVRVKG